MIGGITDALDAAYNKVMAMAAGATSSALSAGVNELQSVKNATAELRAGVLKMAAGKTALQSRLSRIGDGAQRASIVALIASIDTLAVRSQWALDKLDSLTKSLTEYLQSKQQQLGAVVLIATATVVSVLGIVYAVIKAVESKNNEIALKIREIDSAEKAGGSALDLQKKGEGVSVPVLVAGVVGVLVLLLAVRKK